MTARAGAETVKVRTREPRAPSVEVRAGSWGQALRRTRPRIKELNIGLMAAGTAFWGVLSLFPSMIAVIIVYGLARSPQEAAREINHALSGLSGDVRRIVGQQVSSVASSRHSALSVGLVISLAVLLWSASSGMQNLMRALTTAFEQQETRGYLRLRATALLLALGAIVIGALVLGAVAVVPTLLRHALGSSALRWVLLAVEYLLLFVVLVGVLAVLYRFAPAGRPTGARRATAGAVIAALVLAVFTVLFATYVNLVGNYSKTYGTLAGLIIFMLWLYYSAYVVLLGALIDAEGARQLTRSADRELEVMPRDVVRTIAGSVPSDSRASNES